MGTTAAQPDPDPAAELGVQPALGSPLGPFPAFWQDGTKLRDACHLPEALRQLPVEQHRCASRGHRDTEGMRNPSPAIPGLSVLGRARPGSARGRDAGRARRKAEEKGRIPGVPPCLAAIRRLPFAPGRPEEPKCHRGLLFEPPPPACRALTHPRDGGDAAAKAAGLGRTAGTHRTSAPTRSSASPPTPWHPARWDGWMDGSSPPGPAPCRSHLPSAEGHFWL